MQAKPRSTTPETRTPSAPPSTPHTRIVRSTYQATASIAREESPASPAELRHRSATRVQACAGPSASRPASSLRPKRPAPPRALQSTNASRPAAPTTAEPLSATERARRRAQRTQPCRQFYAVHRRRLLPEEQATQALQERTLQTAHRSRGIAPDTGRRIGNPKRATQPLKEQVIPPASSATIAPFVRMLA